MFLILLFYFNVFFNNISFNFSTMLFFYKKEKTNLEPVFISFYSIFKLVIILE
jgi:hypothetical protein